MFRLTSLLLLAVLLVPVQTFALEQHATPADVCPGGEYPAVGALELTTGRAGWIVCSPIEAYRDVLGVGDMVLVQESTPQGHRVIALDPADGTELWRRATALVPTSVGPVTAQGVVVLPVLDLNFPALVGVSSETGTELWRIVSREIPLAHGATITIVGGDSQQTGPAPVRGINRATGEELWISEVSLSDPSGVRVGRSPVAIYGDTAVMPTGETISAINVGTGALLWQSPYLSHLMAADGAVVGIEGQGPATMVTALDIDTGQQLWTARGRASYGGLISVNDDQVIVLTPDGTGMVGLDLATGDERWRATPMARVEPQLAPGDSVVAIWEGKIAVIFTKDGSVTWSATEPFGSPLMNSVGVGGDVIFVAINSLSWSD